MHDFRFAVRQLLKNPAFTIVAVLSLALGIGVNVMMFSFFNAYLLRPVPLIKEPQRIAELQRGDPLGHRVAFSLQEYENLRDHADVFAGLVAYTGPRGGTLMISSEPGAANSSSDSAREEIRAKFVSGNYFSVLGVGAALGRTFLAEEAQTPSSHPVVVLSDELWRGRFAADATLIGKVVRLNNSVCTVVGIAPSDFSGLGDGMLVTEAWIPLQMLPELDRHADWPELQKEFRFQLAGRLKPGLSVEQASAALNVADAQMANTDSEPNKHLWVGLKMGCTFMPWAENVEVVLPIMLAVGLVLLIACANVANLLLARAVGRQKEMGVRLALGAGRGRIVRQLLTESFLIALLGGFLGLLFGQWTGRFAWSLRHEFLPPEIKLVDLNFAPDLRVCSFTLLLVLATALLFGLAPALEALRANLSSALKDEGALFGRRIPRSRLRNFFAMAQIAICLSLLLGAGLLLRAGQKASTVDFGYETKQVALLRFDLRRHGYTDTRAAEFQRQLMERVRAMPGVQSVSLARHTLASREHVDTVSPEYFRTMGIPILRGRAFTPQDGGDGVPVAIVSQATAQRLWGDRDPIGQRMTNAPFAEVVGVARNARNLFECLFNNARPSVALPNAAINDFLYLPLSRSSVDLAEMQMLVRVEGEAKAITSALREQVRALDPNLMASVGPLTQELAGGLKLFRGLAGLAHGIGFVALLLATMGIYGVMAYGVNQRTREIGIRMALGAQKRDVLRWVLQKGGRLIICGLALGLPGGIALSSCLSSLLVGLRPTDPATLIAVSLFLSAVALLACYVPARRATRIDSVEALRDF